MILTKFTHSCVRIQDGDRLLVIDPGVFSEVETALDGVDAVLITHQHPDHIDVGKLAAAATANPNLQIWGPADLAGVIGDHPVLSERLTVVGAGETFDAAGLQVRTFGGQHALIHPNIPTISNVAFLVAEGIYHPGDSFAVPNATLEVALVPLHAPWSKMSEVIDYTVAARAPKAFQIHDSLLTDTGRNMVEGAVTGFGGQFGTTFSHLDAGQSVEL